MRAVRSLIDSTSGGGDGFSGFFGAFSGSVTAAIMPVTGCYRRGVTEPEVTALTPGDAGAARAAAALLGRELGDGLYRPEWLLEDAASPRAGVWIAGTPGLVGVAVAR